MFKNQRKRAFEKIFYILGWIGRAKVWLGIILTSGLITWAASATEWMNQYAPLSWVLSFFVGMLILTLILAGLARFYVWITEAKYNIVRSSNPSSINPLEDVFQKQTINIMDFKMPTLEFVIGKKFIGCHLLGPATIYLKNSSLTDSTFAFCDFIKIPNNSIVQNIIPFDDLEVRNSLLINLTILVPEANAKKTEQGIKGMIWANDIPPKQK